jgi:hypothetical protein
MTPIAKLIRMVQIGKKPSVATADAALVEYAELTQKLSAIRVEMDKLEESTDDGWEAWGLLLDWLGTA